MRLIIFLLLLLTTQACTTNQIKPDTEPKLFLTNEIYKNKNLKISQIVKELSSSEKIDLKNNPIDDGIQTKRGVFDLTKEEGAAAPTIRLSANNGEKFYFNFNYPLKNLSSVYIKQLAICPEADKAAALLTDDSVIFFGFYKKTEEQSWVRFSELKATDLAWLNCDKIIVANKSKALYLVDPFQAEIGIKKLDLEHQKPDWIKLKTATASNFVFIESKYSQASKWHWVNENIAAKNSVKPQKLLGKNIVDIDANSEGIYVIKNSRKNNNFVLEKYDLKFPLNNQPLASKKFDEFIDFKNPLTTFDNSILIKILKNGTNNLIGIQTTSIRGNYQTLEHQGCSLSLKPTLLVKPAKLKLICDHFNYPRKSLDLNLSTLEIKDNSTLKEIFPNYKVIYGGGDKKPSIPITLLPSLNNKIKTSPVLLVVYGAYGQVTTPRLHSWWNLLRAQGFTVAIPHIRGSGFYGENWHQQGKGINIKNRIEDLNRVVNFLVTDRDISASKIIGYGKSAGAFPLVIAATKNYNNFSGLVLEAPIISPIEQITKEDPFYDLEIAEWGDFKSENIANLYNQFDLDLDKNLSHLPPVYLRLSTQDTLVSSNKLLSIIGQKKEAGLKSITLDISNTATHTGEPDYYDELERQAKMVLFISSK